MKGFLLVVIIAVALYNVFVQVFRGIKPSDLFRVNMNYTGTFASSTPQTPNPPAGGEVQTQKNTYIVKPSEVPSAPKEENKPQITPPVGFTVAQLSPWYKKIQISSLYVPRSSNEASSFTLRSDWNMNEGVNISGWYLKANSGATVDIPKAVNLYHPLRAVTEDIVMRQGSQVNVTSASSPLGVNIEFNKCTGYLNDIYAFAPSLPNNCPGVNRNDVMTFKGECQSFILSLGSCRAPTSNEINNYASNDDQCRNFLNTLNYAGCYNRYSADTNFLSNEWRVWLGKEIPFDREHDRALLFDKNGLLVNEYVY